MTYELVPTTRRLDNTRKELISLAPVQNGRNATERYIQLIDLLIVEARASVTEIDPEYALEKPWETAERRRSERVQAALQGQDAWGVPGQASFNPKKYEAAIRAARELQK